MNLFDLSGKTALVTGGNGGIGLGIARGFVEHGASVVLLGRNTNKLKSASIEIGEKFGYDKVDAMKCDVTDRSSISKVLNDINNCICFP